MISALNRSCINDGFELERKNETWQLKITCQVSMIILLQTLWVTYPSTPLFVFQ